MKPLGIKKKDNDCCPGHNKFSSETYNNRRSKRAKRRDTKYAHGRTRMWSKQDILKQLKDGE